MLNIGTGESRPVGQSPSGTFHTNLLEWTADGQRLLYGLMQNGSETAWIVPANGGASVQLSLRLRDDQRAPYRSAKLHPDNRRILLTSSTPVINEVRTLENFIPSQTGK